MADRLADVSGDGLIDYLPIERSTINPSSYVANLDACPSFGTPPILTYTWTLGGVVTFDTTSCLAQTFVPSADGTELTVRLTVDNGVDTAEATKVIAPRDWFIVSLGDSYASGEGNPERDCAPGQFGCSQLRWQDGGFGASECHRSSKAAPALAALELEEVPHSSVTFVHLACSGATIQNGILGRYGGRVDNGVFVPAQLAQLRPLVTGGSSRVPDVVLVSIGGNDIHFGERVRSCLFGVKSCSRFTAAVQGGLERVRER